MYTVAGKVFELSGIGFVACELVTADEFKSPAPVVVDFDEVLIFVVATLGVAGVHLLNKARGVDRLVVGRASSCGTGGRVTGKLKPISGNSDVLVTDTALSDHCCCGYR